MRANIKMALFTGIFVFIVILLSEFLMPENYLFIKPIIAGLSGLIGSVIGHKLYPIDDRYG